MVNGVGTDQFNAPAVTGLAMYNYDLLWTSYNAGATYLNGVPESSGSNIDSRYVTTDGDNVYWTASDGNQVWYAPLSTSGSSAAPTLLSGYESQPWGITADGPYSIYWVNKTSGTIRHARYSGGTWTVRSLAQGSSPSDICADQNYLYWTDTGSNRILSLRKW